MPVKVLRVGLLLSFLCLYLEWGKGQHTVVAALEWQLISFQKETFAAFAHPLIFLPFAGQLILLFTLFSSAPRRWQTRTGIVLMGTLAFVVLLVGIIDFNLAITASAVPFWVLAVLLWKKS